MNWTERIIVLAIGIVAASIILLLSVGTSKGAEVDQAELPYPQAFECWGVDNVKKVDTYLGETKGMKFFVMNVDTNNDGKKDGMMLYPVLAVKEGGFEISTQPMYIIRDEDYNGTPDKAYFDPSLGTDCKALKVIPLETLLKDVKGA